MRASIYHATVTFLLAASALVGCGSKPPAHIADSSGDRASIDQAAITGALAKLSPEDRALAESQKYCAIATENPLGSMGTPLKLEVSGETVFLCCAGCKSKALGNPEETLASVAKLKADRDVSE